MASRTKSLHVFRETNRNVLSKAARPKFKAIAGGFFNCTELEKAKNIVSTAAFIGTQLKRLSSKMLTDKRLKQGVLRNLTTMQPHEDCTDIPGCSTHADLQLNVESAISRIIMLHNTSSVYYDRRVYGSLNPEPNYSAILGYIKVGDRVRLIKLSTGAVAEFAAEGTVTEVNLAGVEQKVAYKTFTTVDFDVLSATSTSSAEQGLYKVRDAWLMKLSN